MAKRTMEKNAFLKFFDILKDNFFNITMLGSILSLIIVALLSMSFGLSWLLVHFFGKIAIFNYLVFIPFILLTPCMTAVLRIYRNYVREVPVMLWSDIKQAFKENFFQSFILGILQFFVVVLLCISYNFYSLTASIQPDSLFPQVGLAVSYVAAFAVLIISAYAMMMIVTLNLKLGQIIKNSALFVVGCLPRNVLMILALAVWTGFCGVLVYVAIFTNIAIVGGFVLLIIALFFMAFTLYIMAYFTFPAIQKHILDPYYESHPEETSNSLKSMKTDEDNDENNDIDLPEYVYHNGRMVHRSIFEREKLVDDDKDE